MEIFSFLLLLDGFYFDEKVDLSHVSFVILSPERLYFPNPTWERQSHGPKRDNTTV